jgi:hypothetical protein
MDATTLGMGDDAAAAQILYFLPIGLRGQVMGDVEAAKFGDIVIAGHGYFLLVGSREDAENAAAASQ